MALYFQYALLIFKVYIFLRSEYPLSAWSSCVVNLVKFSQYRSFGEKNYLIKTSDLTVYL